MPGPSVQDLLGQSALLQRRSAELLKEAEQQHQQSEALRAEAAELQTQILQALRVPFRSAPAKRRANRAD